jgi:hypothetical protein
VQVMNFLGLLDLFFLNHFPDFYLLKTKAMDCDHYLLKSQGIMC